MAGSTQFHNWQDGNHQCPVILVDFFHAWRVQISLTFYQTDDSFDINQIHIGRGDEVLDIAFHHALVLDMDPQWDGTVL